MDSLSRRFNEMLMQEMGFDVQSDGSLIDQDLGIPIKFEGVPVVAPSVLVRRDDTTQVPFDPYNNTRMMNQMFSHFMTKLTELGEINHYDVVFNEDHGKGGGVVTIRNETSEISSSRPYVRESCKYADLVFQLNDDSVPDMKDFDITKAKQKDMVKKEHTKFSTRKHRGNKR